MRRFKKQFKQLQQNKGKGSALGALKKALRINIRRNTPAKGMQRMQQMAGELSSMKDKSMQGRKLRGDQGRQLSPRGRTDSTPGRNLKESAMSGSKNLQSTYAKSTNAVKPGKGRKKRVKKAPQSELKQNMNTSGLSIKADSAGMNL